MNLGSPSCGPGSDTHSAGVALATRAESAALEKMLRLPPLADDDWALEAELRGVQRMLGSLKLRAAAPTEPMSIHLPHDAPATWHVGERPPDEERDEPAEVIEQQPRSNAAAWTILSLGLAVFTCGAVLLTWSLVGQREDLWPVGLPLALIGQAGMVLGVVLQLESLVGGAKLPRIASHPLRVPRQRRAAEAHR